MTSTTAEAIAPTLAALKDPFRLALQSAEEEANETLDQILSEGARPLIVKIIIIQFFNDMIFFFFVCYVWIILF